MKSITLHPISVLVGLALAGLVAISTGAAQAVQPIPTRTQVVGVVPAAWITYVRVTSTAPYTVPLDRRFVVTRALTGAYGLTVNGIPDVEVGLDAWNISFEDSDTRVALQPGDVIAVPFPNAPAQLWGYLEPL